MFLPFLSLAMACTPARRNGLTAVEHETRATQEERAAAEHRRVAGTGPVTAPCVGGTETSGLFDGSPCWTALRNPTADNLAEAEAHRRRAAAHRAASRALREAEARACAGVSEADRAMSPFARHEDILDLRVLRDERGRKVGAAATFARVPGLSVAGMERLVHCHLARNAAFGPDPHAVRCPLAVPGAEAEVAAVPGGVEVRVRARSPERATEVARRIASRWSRTARR